MYRWLLLCTNEQNDVNKTVLNYICELLDRASKNYRERSSKFNGPAQWIDKDEVLKPDEPQNASEDEFLPDFSPDEGKRMMMKMKMTNRA